MPTGYTAKLMESGQTFEEFVLQCARAFGACIDMRDDPMDAPIPEQFEPSDYNVKRLAEAKRELKRLQKMSSAEKLAFGKSEKARALEGFEEWLNRELEQGKRLAEMESKVFTWTPPTPDHVGLKEFMLQQIKISKTATNYIEDQMEATNEKSPIEFYNEAVSKEKQDIEYHSKEAKQEVERVRSRTEWVKQLRNSLNN